MKLERVQISNYKSLANVDVTLEPDVTVFVGQNASGKSNFVDALRLVQNTSKSIADVAAGGIKKRVSNRPLYALPLHYVDGNELSVQIFFSSDRYWNFRFAKDQYATTTDDEIESAAKRWQFSNPAPIVMRDLSSDYEGEILAETARNLSTIVQAAQQTKRGRESLVRILSAMQVISPDLVAIRTESLASYVLVLFDYQRKNGEKVTFDPRSLSDGTLRIFAILVALYLRNGAELIVIEEPELNVHPGVLGVVAAAIKEVSEVAQIVITTHSPEFVNHFKPEQIRVVTMNDGVTQIAPIKQTQLESVQEGLMSLSEFMSAEGLLPQQT